MPIHRHIKNVVHHYTDAERKVREATSNDPWGPSSTLMAEIADKTHNVMAFTEIMKMIWKRLNDKNKNWRHVYKALVLLEHLVKTGSVKVASQCCENIHSIETLRDFEYFEDGKDLGFNVREKARLLSTLLRDEEKLREERAKALLARKRMMHGGFGITSSDGDSPSRFEVPLSGRSGYPFGASASYLDERSAPSYSKSSVSLPSAELDSVRPHSVGEENLHLQLALALSKEEYDREERRRRAEEAKEEAKVQMVLEQSRRDEQVEKPTKQPLISTATSSTSSASGGLFSLVDTSLSAAPAHLPDPWSTPLPVSSSSFNNSATTAAATSSAKFQSIPIDDPWNPNLESNSVITEKSDTTWNLVSTLGSTLPGSAGLQSTSNDPSDSTSSVSIFEITTENSFSNMNGNDAALPNSNSGSKVSSSADGEMSSAQQPIRKRTPADFLGEHQRLVDLEKLVEKSPASTNPFTVNPRPLAGVSLNPFLANQPIKPSLNQLAPTQPQQALPGPADLQKNPMFCSIQPYYGAMQTAYTLPLHTNPWPTDSSQHQTRLNPFY